MTDAFLCHVLSVLRVFLLHLKSLSLGAFLVKGALPRQQREVKIFQSLSQTQEKVTHTEVVVDFQSSSSGDCWSMMSQHTSTVSQLYQSVTSCPSPTPRKLVSLGRIGRRSSSLDLCLCTLDVPLYSSIQKVNFTVFVFGLTERNCHVIFNVMSRLYNATV